MDSILLENLEIYQLALEVGEIVWKTVESWEWFAKKTIGSQFTRAADSLSANIAEGNGRYFYKDRRVFCYYSRGSLLETKNWAIKALSRSLISQQDYDVLIEKMKDLHHKLNIYIKKLNANIT
jgi:four helix bundle protein